MTPDELRDKIRRRAGARRQQIPVRILDRERLLPPTLRRRKRTKVEREVIVSASWLRRNAPELWAAYVAGRLLDAPDRLVLELK